MKNILKYYWLDVLLIGGFIVFTFVYPVKIISAVCAGIIAVCLYLMVAHDDRIHDPYTSILGLAIFATYYWFISHYLM